MMNQKHILVIDDDTRLRQLLNRYLTSSGFLISEASCPAEAREMMQTFTFDLLILDVMMPGENGFSFAKNLRESGNGVPILMLTAMGDIQDRILGLETGVDDYLTKPFEPKELLLRLNNILKRIQAAPTSGSHLRFGSLVYNRERGELSSSGEFVSLTAVEKELLFILSEQPGTEVSREELTRRTGTVNERTIDVQVNRLRKKMEADAKNPRYLQTVRGKGYILLPD